MSKSGATDARAWTKLSSTVVKNIGILGAALYFGGWVYLNRYYSQFDIDINMLELSWHDVVIHSVALLKNGIKLLLGWPPIVLLVASLAAFRFLEHHHAVFSSLLEQVRLHDSRLLVPMILALSVLIASSLAAQYVGAVQARRDWVAAREPVLFGFKGDDCLKDSHLEEANKNLKLRLLKSTSKWYFVIVQNSNQTLQKRPLPVRVFHIPTACIASAQRQISPR